MDETHRVVAIENGEHGGKVFATKGDANSTLDPWRIAVKGKIWRRVYSVQRLGYAFGMLHGQTAHLAVTLLPAFVLAGWVLVWVWKPVLAAASAARSATENDGDDRAAA
jgi:hypothetical protein